MLLSLIRRGYRLARVSQRAESIGVAAFASLISACGPHIYIPPVPSSPPGAVSPSDSSALLARSLAPVLYLQRDEFFPLKRVVAVVHPTRSIVAYHLMWRDDVNGSWIPFTVATDQEVIWIGYDPSGAPTDVWTYWHGDVLHAPWEGKQVTIAVQWGKHGSLPYDVEEGSLPTFKRLSSFYWLEFLLLPDMWLGNTARKGPWGFFHGPGRYKDFSRMLPLHDRIDAVLRTDNPTEGLRAVFGAKFSEKKVWPTK
jgi:hypothetical protein